MGPEKIQRKFNDIKQLLNDLHQAPKKIADENYEYHCRELALYEDLIEPEMNDAEMYSIEGELGVFERLATIFKDPL